MAERYGSPRGRVAVVELEEPVADAVVGAEASDDELIGSGVSNPLYPVALLKIAMAMKRLSGEEERHFDAILDDVLSDMVIDREDFRAYLTRNMGRLLAAVRCRGY